MANYGNEQLEAAIRDEQVGQVLAVLGWTLLVFDAIPLVWVWQGWHDGSLFWLWWLLGLGAAGLLLVGAGAVYRARAEREYTASARRNETAPREEEQPSPPEDEQRAA